MTFQDLKKELLKAEKEKNKIKINSLKMIIDMVKKIAEENNEKITEIHIQKGIEKYLDYLEKTQSKFMPLEDELKFVKEFYKQFLKRL